MLDVHKKMFNEYALEVVAYDNIPTSDDEKIKRIADADCLCSIGRTKTKSGRAETDKSKLNKKRVTKSPEKVTAEYFKTE